MKTTATEDRSGENKLVADESDDVERALARERELAISYHTIANALREAGDHQAALDAERKAFVILERLRDAQPQRYGRWQELAVSQHRIARALRNAGDSRAAFAAYGETLAIVERLVADDRLETGGYPSAENAEWLEELHNEVRATFLEIASIGESKKSGYTGGTTPDKTGGTVGDPREYFALAAKFVEKAYEDGLPVAELGEAIEDKLAAKAAARETTSRAAAEPRPEGAATETAKRKRGPRVKPNPALPSEAPEIYRDRKPREELDGRKENIVQFIERVYAPWHEILTRPDLRRLDETADEGVGNWISYHKQPFPNGLLPTEFELNTAKRRAKPSRRSAARMGIPHRNIFTPFR